MDELIKAIRDVLGVNAQDKGHRTVARREARQYLRQWVRDAESGKLEVVARPGFNRLILDSQKETAGEEA